jgi:hypothetical protein
MIIEMRTYTVKSNTALETEERFGKALPNRTKFSPMAAFWHSEVGQLNQVIHIWPYESLAERDRVRAAAAKADGWPPNIGEFIVTQRAEILVPAPFSPPLEPRAMGNIYEIRTYTVAARSMPRILQLWSEKIEARTKLSPLAAAWYTEFGELNKFIHIWPYKDSNERDRIRAEAVKLGIWPPATSEFMIHQENSIVIPAPFSPLH